MKTYQLQEAKRINSTYPSKNGTHLGNPLAHLQKKLGNQHVTKLFQVSSNTNFIYDNVIQRKIHVHNQVDEIKPFLPEQIVFWPNQIFSSDITREWMSAIFLNNDNSNWNGAQWISKDALVPYPLLSEVEMKPKDYVMFHFTMTIDSLVVDDKAKTAKLRISNVHATIRKHEDQNTILETLKKLKEEDYSKENKETLESRQSKSIKNSFHRSENSKQWNSGNKENNDLVAAYMNIENIKNVRLDIDFEAVKKTLSRQIAKNLQKKDIQLIEVTFL